MTSTWNLKALCFYFYLFFIFYLDRKCLKTHGLWVTLCLFCHICSYAKLDDKAWSERYKMTRLHYVINHNRLAAVQSLLESKADPNETKGTQMYSPLAMAFIYNPDASIARLLLEAGASTEKRGYNGKNILHQLTDYYTKRNIPSFICLLSDFPCRHLLFEQDLCGDLPVDTAFKNRGCMNLIKFFEKEMKVWSQTLCDVLLETRLPVRDLSLIVVSYICARKWSHWFKKKEITLHLHVLQNLF